MGVDLSSLERGGDFHWNWSGWESILKTGEAYGWQPMGTELHPIEFEEGEPFPDKETIDQWDGSYCWNAWQTVVQEDARNLAAALRLYLEELRQRGAEDSAGPDARDSAGSKGLRSLEEFITLCEAGAFVIT